MRTDEAKPTAETLVSYRKLAELSEKTYRDRYRAGRVTHYLHVMFYHHEELHAECLQDGRSLGSYKQQGWEKMNDEDRVYIERHTTKGAAVGRPSKKRKLETTNMEERPKSKSWDMVSTTKEFQTLAKLSLDTLQEKMRTKNLPISGTKNELATRLMQCKQRERAIAEKQLERSKDPIGFKKWWRASVIVQLLQKQCRDL